MFVPIRSTAAAGGATDAFRSARAPAVRGDCRAFAASLRVQRPRSRRRGGVLYARSVSTCAHRRSPRPPHARASASLGLDLSERRSEAARIPELRRVSGRLRRARASRSTRAACEPAPAASPRGRGRASGSPIPKARRCRSSRTTKCSPGEKAAAQLPVAVAPGKGAAPARSSLGTVRPRRLSHILLFTSDVLRSVRFYSDALGLRLSDHSGDIIAFMHGAHASDHHMLAFAKSDGPGLHHSSWDVGEPRRRRASACSR